MKDTIFNSNFTLNCQGNLHEFNNALIMGIINTTPDSFFEGSRKNTLSDVLAQVSTFITEGVDIIDIGGYSSRPGAKNITIEEELARVIPVIKSIRSAFPEILISIDTFRTEVADQALQSGANIINDITGGVNNESIYSIATKYNAPYIMMHMRGTPENMQSKTEYKNLMNDLILFFSVQLKIAQDKGIKDLIIDPGLGFSKTVDQNYTVLSKLRLLNVLDKPILIGASRKSMLYKPLNIESGESLNATSVINTVALQNGANILRVHDVKEAVEVKFLLNKLAENN